MSEIFWFSNRARRLFQVYRVSHDVQNARLQEKLSDALSLQIETLIESH